MDDLNEFDRFATAGTRFITRSVTVGIEITGADDSHAAAAA